MLPRLRIASICRLVKINMPHLATPLRVSVDGMFGCEDDFFVRRLGDIMAARWERLRSQFSRKFAHLIGVSLSEPHHRRLIVKFVLLLAYLLDMSSLIWLIVAYISTSLNYINYINGPLIPFKCQPW